MAQQNQFVAGKIARPVRGGGGGGAAGGGGGHIPAAASYSGGSTKPDESTPGKSRRE